MHHNTNRNIYPYKSIDTLLCIPFDTSQCTLYIFSSKLSYMFLYTYSCKSFDMSHDKTEDTNSL